MIGSTGKENNKKIDKPQSSFYPHRMGLFFTAATSA